VVINNIEHHLNTGEVQRFHHGSKFIQADKRVFGATVAEMGRKEGDWIVAPVFANFYRGSLCIELKNRQEFDCSDTQRLQIRNFLYDPELSPPICDCDAGLRVARKSRNVHFVNDGRLERTVKGCVTFPVEKIQVGDYTFHRGCCVVTRLTRGGSTVCRPAATPCRMGQ
jgi:hypothetical protein